VYNLPIFKNERDVEIPLLLNWLDRNDARYASVLDVGCALSAYLPEVRKLVGYIHGIDIQYDKKIVPYLDEYIVEDFLYADLGYYDYVFSISTIEHVGVEYLPTKLYRELQLEFFSKIVELSKRGFFLTFPYGENDLFAGKYYNGNRRVLDNYLKIARGCKIYKKFISTPDQKDPWGWREIPQELADKATNELSGGVRTICVLEGYK